MIFGKCSDINTRVSVLNPYQAGTQRAESDSAATYPYGVR